ncbi:type II toxin-antitoxin system RelE/ParE family toxin [Aureimonas glaciei]|uniref:Toxin n=1 Tax=Aureimonas glaciei TaxID=1776957 RepID=A0A916V2M5_9HYPH|nr:type II toxin-antitoxin system RelE/ParE family toxin [Aureimonas glaciei]GGD02870.1 toxin ParE1 [Aureimonas glaciei]
MPSTVSRLRLNPKASADLDGIFLDTAVRWSSEQADRYIAEIDDAMRALARSPGLGQKVDDVRAGYYRYRAGSHLIFYRRVEPGIEVMRVLHQRMDIDRHL